MTCDKCSKPIIIIDGYGYCYCNTNETEYIIVLVGLMYGQEL